MSINTNKKVAFVILHYLALDVTARCIESIQKVLSCDDYHIVVVDNGSDNSSGKELMERYAGNDDVEVICLEKNLGFSAGNNVGYSYAKEQLHSEFIIVINNDTEMIQEDFVERAIKCYDNVVYYVLGPDIINLEGVHQSPQRDHVITKVEARKWYIKRWLFSTYLHIHKRLKLSDDCFVLKRYMRHDNDRKAHLLTDIAQENVELQGACFIFSPIYVEKNEKAFEELTFMYGEEALLLLRCAKNGWKVVYDPKLKIKHAEKAVTKRINKNVIEKEIFWSDNHVKAIKAIINKINEEKY